MFKFFHKYKILLPILLLTGLCIWTLQEGLIGTTVIEGDRTINTHVNLDITHYCAFALVFINLLSFLFFRRFTKYILLLTLTLGLLDIINFTPSHDTVSYGFNSLAIQFQTSSLQVGIITYILYFKRINGSIIHFFNPPFKQTPEIDSSKYREQINKVKERFAKYSNDELSSIVTEKKYTPEAWEAAQELLSERQSSKYGFS
jgi:hypothetical protein